MKKNILRNSALVLAAAISITACKKPVATFTASTTTPMVGEYVVFTDGQEEKAMKKLEYTYDFGDGTQMTGVANPSHAYTMAGTYKVTQQIVKAKNEQRNGRMAVLTTDITVTAAAAAFDASKSAVYEGETILFTNTTDDTKGSPVDYRWVVYNEIGQEYTSSWSKNFTWTPNGNGKYKVVLWAMQGASKTSKDMEVTVSGFNNNDALAAFLSGEYTYTVNVSQTFGSFERNPSGLEIYSSIVLNDGNAQTSKLKSNNNSSNGLGNPGVSISVSNGTLVNVNGTDGLWNDATGATTFGVSLASGDYVAALNGSVLTLTNIQYDNTGSAVKTSTLVLTKK